MARRTLLCFVTALLTSACLSLAAIPTEANAATSQSSKAQAKKKASSQAKAKARKHKASRVTRSGKRRAYQNRITAAQRQRMIALANLPHRVGPTEVFQNPNAQSNLLLESRAALIINAETGEMLYGKNAYRSMPIASITKLMTAMVVLDARLPLDEVIAISEADVDHLRHTHSRLVVGTQLTRHELLLLALMSSENRAAAALARSYPGGTAAAVAAMNRKAQEIGMTRANFLDSTGLHSENSASPADLVKLVKAANHYPEIHEYSTATEHTIFVNNKMQTYRNTNALVKNADWKIDVSKTGFINEAGKCLVMHARIHSTPVVIVLMDSNGRYTRIGDANRVKTWLESSLGFNSAQ